MGIRADKIGNRSAEAVHTGYCERKQTVPMLSGCEHPPAATATFLDSSLSDSSGFRTRLCRLNSSNDQVLLPKVLCSDEWDPIPHGRLIVYAHFRVTIADSRQKTWVNESGLRSRGFCLAARGMV